MFSLVKMCEHILKTRGLYMKDILKKFVSSLLALTVLLSLCGVINVFAAENNMNDNFNPYSFPSNAELKSIKVNNGDFNDLSIIEALSVEKNIARVDNDFEDRASSSVVAIMRIFAINDGGSSSFNTSGHAFLSIENISGSAINVGALLVASGKTVTIGTWGNKDEHTGLWYNLEGYFQNSFNAYANAVSLRVDLTYKLLGTVSQNIINNDTWTALSNCSTFATKIWNSVCSTTVSAGVPSTPTATVQSIKSYSNLYSTGVDIPYFGTVYYGNPPVASSAY